MTTARFMIGFGLDDQASARIGQVQQATDRLTQSATAASLKVLEIGRSVETVASRASGRGLWKGGDRGRAMQENAEAARLFGQQLQQLAMKGNLSAASLQKLTSQTQVLRQSLRGDAGLTNSLNTAQKNLGLTSTAMKVSEEKFREGLKPIRQTTTAVRNVGMAAKSTAGRFTFMGDVSDVTARKMRRVSAAAQGAMLGLALMEKNIIGMAFSLIFLQFSGFLKLSLAIAAASVVFIPFAKRFQTWLDQRKAVEQMANSVQISTGNLKAMGLVTGVATKLVEDLGLTGDAADDMKKALTGAIVEIRKINEEPTPEMLKVFISAFAIARGEGIKLEEAMGVAFSQMQDFISDGAVTIKSKAGETTVSLEDLMRDGSFAMFGLGEASLLTAEQVIEAFRRVENELGKGWFAETRYIPALKELLSDFAPEVLFTKEDALDLFRQVLPHPKQNMGGAFMQQFEEVLESPEFKDIGVSTFEGLTTEWGDILTGSTAEGGAIKTGVDDILEVIEEINMHEVVSGLDDMPKKWGAAVDEAIPRLKPLQYLLDEATGAVTAINDGFKELKYSIPDFSGFLDPIRDGFLPTPLPDPEEIFFGSQATRGNQASTNVTVVVDVHDNAVKDENELAGLVSSRLLDAMGRITTIGFNPGV